MFKTANSETSWLEAFLKGENWAFSRIYERYHRPILRLVFLRVNDREIASDLCQEIFLKVHRFRLSYRPGYAFSTWLWAIARNTVSDWLRSGASPKGTAYLLAVDELPCHEPNAEAMLVRESERASLKRFLGRLTFSQKKVLLLRLVHHLSYQEISHRLGVSISAVKCLVYRSKRALTRKFLVSGS